ncbi:glycine betaine ABC transporter substrate-binding protein [Cobetia marina]
MTTLMTTPVLQRSRRGLSGALMIAGLALASLGALVSSPLASAEEEAAAWPEDKPIVVGSKADREGHLLGEIFAQVLEDAGFTVERRLGLGQTIITYQGLAEGGAGCLSRVHRHPGARHPQSGQRAAARQARCSES